MPTKMPGKLVFFYKSKDAELWHAAPRMPAERWTDLEEMR
jgi:hypothetical protein